LICYAILATTFVESGQYDEYILDIETVFLDENNSNVGPFLLYTYARIIRKNIEINRNKLNLEGKLYG
jgi:hypothetical protein